YKVILEVQPQFQDDPSALSKIYVPGPPPSAGSPPVQIPLSSFAHFTAKVEPLLLSHQGQFPAVTISFNLAPGVALGEAIDRIQALERELHMPATVTGAFTGTAQAFQASLSSTPLLVAAAILVVYIVLGVLYESYIHPITILSALPSAGVGALLVSQWLTLYTTPVIYLYLDRLSHFFGGKRRQPSRLAEALTDRPRPGRLVEDPHVAE